MSGLEITTASRMPPSAYVFAWLCLAAQLPALATRGLSDADGIWVLLSMVLSALVVGWFAAGVLRGRPVRLVLVWIIVVLGTVLTGVGVVVDLSHTSGWDLLLLLVSIGQVGALAAFCSTDYFQWQRARPSAPGPDISALVAIAVVVGLLGGLTAAADGNSAPVQLRVGL
jgi:hypothetical protein